MCSLFACDLRPGCLHFAAWVLALCPWTCTQINSLCAGDVPSVMPLTLQRGCRKLPVLHLCVFLLLMLCLRMLMCTPLHIACTRLMLENGPSCDAFCAAVLCQPAVAAFCWVCCCYSSLFVLLGFLCLP